MNILFALVALCCAADSFTVPWRYHPESVTVFLTAAKWSSAWHALLATTLVWFLADYAESRNTWIPKAFNFYVVVVVTIHFFVLPFGLLFRSLPELHSEQLPWGEWILVPKAAPGPSIILANLIGLTAAIYSVQSCIYLWRRGDRKKARTLSCALAPMILIAYPHGVMINWGLISPPYLYPFAFFGLVGIMSMDLINDAVRSTELSKIVESNERRWRTLLENVQLAVVGCNRAGILTYANPFFYALSGFKQEEILGRNFVDVIPASAQLAVKNLFRSMISNEPQEHTAFPILRKSGEDRSVFWSNVLVHDEHGTVSGTLSIGADVTEQQKAETARDEALQKLEEMRARLEAENIYLREEVFPDAGSTHLTGQSDAIRYVLHKIREVSKTAATVLIEGETGVGKELVARAVHESSTRSENPFIRVNCAALPPTLAESELFGHEKGAFTGADRLRKGRFELADGGTLFLDEVGELPLEVQAKLLRVLQEGEFERVGDSHTRKADVRVIAATNRNLRREVASGRFREDLFYRLQIYPITVPPLRERRDDIPLLVRHFANKLALRYNKSIEEIPGHAINDLTNWDWPGNVRELENVIERAVIASTGPVLNLPQEFGKQMRDRSNETQESFVSLDEMERSYIRRVLDHTSWKIAGPGGTAEILGIHSNTLRSRMAKLGVSRALKAHAALK